MRRIALALTASAALITLSGCGALNVVSEIQKLGNSDIASTSTTPTPTTTSTAKSSKSSTSRAASSSTAKSSKTTEPSAKSGEKTRTVAIPPEQQKIIKEALEPLVKAHVTAPSTDTMSGKIKFDSKMKPTSYTEFKLNGQTITPDAAAKTEANKAFEKLAGTADKDKFSELEFEFSKNMLETTVMYDNR